MVESTVQVTINAMWDVYWLGKQEIAYRQLLPLLGLQEESGLTDMKFWKHQSEHSQKDQRRLFGQLLKKQLVECISSSKWFSILVDEVTDCSVLEQLLVYVGICWLHWWSRQSPVSFLGCKESSGGFRFPQLSHFSRTDPGGVVKWWTKPWRPVWIWFRRSVCNGRSREWGGFQAESPKCSRTHCICHTLAMACGDSHDEVRHITVVERTLVQLWKWLDHPKKTAAYAKALASYQHLQLADKAPKTLATKISKACPTRWLSIGNNVVRVADNLVPLLQKV